MTDSKPLLSFLLNHDSGVKYPHQLVARFPHVARHMESHWNDAQAMADYFTELMISKRPNRQGFPPDVAMEIMSLSMAYGKIGRLKALEDGPKRTITGQHRWETERLIKEIEELGYAFTKEGFAKAAEAGNREICEKFVKAGFDVDNRDSRDWTPLMIACFHGREQLALMLLDYGADLFAKDRGGYTPLHWAAFSGYQEVVGLLLGRGVPANVLSNAGISPLLQASARGHLEVISQLLESKANPNLNANDGSSPLFKAIANKHIDVIQVLLNAGASRHVTLRDGTTLEDIVKKTKDSKIFAMFV